MGSIDADGSGVHFESDAPGRRQKILHLGAMGTVRCCHMRALFRRNWLARFALRFGQRAISFYAAAGGTILRTDQPTDRVSLHVWIDGNVSINRKCIRVRPLLQVCRSYPRRW